MIRLVLGAFLITVVVAAGISLAPMILDVLGLMLLFPLHWVGLI